MKLGIDIGRVIINGDGPDTKFLGVSEELAMAAPAMEGAFGAITRLVIRFGIEHVWLVSKCGANVQRKSRLWLEHHGFFAQTRVKPEHLRFCLKRPEKATICEQLGITHFVDDRPDVLEAMDGKVPHRFLFDSWARVEPAIYASLDELRLR